MSDCSGCKGGSNSGCDCSSTYAPTDYTLARSCDDACRFPEPPGCPLTARWKAWLATTDDPTIMLSTPESGKLIAVREKDRMLVVELHGGRQVLYPINTPLTPEDYQRMVQVVRGGS